MFGSALGMTFGARRAGAQHDMAHMADARRSVLDGGVSRVASGTSWLPDSAASNAAHAELGGWMFHLHGAAFGMYDKQWTLHGDTRWAVLDWEMARASRTIAGGVFRVSAMTSLESFFLPDTGYPELLQSGESVAGRRIANSQHPHDVVNELAAAYDHSITSKLATSIYAAAIGEPALGPVAFRHRTSAAGDPFAPLGEHWQDAAHQSHGVVTGGVYSSAIKLEGSVFNAREPDANRRDIEYRGARLDSYAGRVTVAPTSTIALAAWAGYLASHDPLDPGVGMQRFGASILGEHSVLGGRHLSTAVIWGLNNHHHGARGHDHEGVAAPPTHHLSSSALLEGTLALTRRTSVFARAEQVQKTADDLGFIAGNLFETFNVRAVTVGATRDLLAARGLSTAIGGRLAYNFLPQTLRYTYTTTHPAGFAVYLRILPAARQPM